jgi:translocation and assembly module TamA
MLRLRAAGLLGLVAAGCAGEAAEGRPWVHNLKLSGIKHVSESDLRSKIAIDETSWVPLSPRRYLDPFALDIDKKRIESYYQTHGYFDARVTEAEVKYRDPAKESVDIQITVDEGPPTYIHDIDIKGLESLPEKERRALLKIRLKPGDRFNYDRYDAARERLEGRLKAEGYAWASVKGQVEVDRDARQARIRLTATPGQRATLGPLTITGNSSVRADLIAHFSGYTPGERFSPEAIEALRGRIYNLGLFSAVKVEYVHDPRDPAVADVQVTVREGQFHELRLGAGFGIESQRTDVHASGIYTKRNFLGGLRTLRLRLEPAYVAVPAFWTPTRQGPAGTAEAQFTQPDLFWRVQLRWTVGYDLGIDYAYQYHGPRTELALQRRFWRDRLQLGVQYGFQLLTFFHTDPTILNDPAKAGRLFGFVDPYRLGWLQEDLALDLRDRPLDATRGGYFGLSLEEGGAWSGGAFQYQKVTPDVRGYLPLGRRVVIAARVQFGQIVTQGDLGSPITRRYYLGGPSSHRGFNYNRLSLQVPSGLSGVPPIPVGGDQMVLLQTEVRVSLFRLFGYWLSFAAFLDAGDVAAPACPPQTCGAQISNLPHQVKLDNLHYATGGGLRYKTVIGTVRVDLGVRLNRLSAFEANGTPNPDPGQRFAFHISVGEAF